MEEGQHIQKKGKVFDQGRGRGDCGNSHGKPGGSSFPKVVREIQEIMNPSGARTEEDKKGGERKQRALFRKSGCLRRRECD